MSGCAGGLQILEALASLRPVDSPKCVSWRNKAEVPSDYGRNRIRQLRRQVFERCVDNAAKPTRGEPPLAVCLVNWANPANFQRSCRFLFGHTGAAVVSRVAQQPTLRTNEL